MPPQDECQDPAVRPLREEFVGSRSDWWGYEGVPADYKAARPQLRRTGACALGGDPFYPCSAGYLSNYRFAERRRGQACLPLFRWY